MGRTQAIIALLLLGSLVTSCDASDETVADPPSLSGPVNVELTSPPPKLLSSYNLFTWDAQEGFTFHDGVVPYDLSTPLFSDYALKKRAIYIPEGQSASYEAYEAFEFPVGTVIIKNFYFPADFRQPDKDMRLIETRLLVRYEDRWETWPYLWNEGQTDAEYAPSGEVRAISFVDPSGATQTANYLVPQRNQCQSCHLIKDGAGTKLVPIGPKARYLNSDYDYGGDVGTKNQLTHLAELGMLTGLPPLDSVDKAYDFSSIQADGAGSVPAEELDAAARDYLDINCAHCHSPVGIQGITSQLFLDRANNDLFHLGVCKRPGSAGLGTGGLTYDVVPGKADASILVFRVATEEVGAMMPLLGRSLTHTQGADLLTRWIDAMDPVDCDSVVPPAP